MSKLLSINYSRAYPEEITLIFEHTKVRLSLIEPLDSYIRILFDSVDGVPSEFYRSIDFVENESEDCSPNRMNWIKREDALPKEGVTVLCRMVDNHRLVWSDGSPMYRVLRLEMMGNYNSLIPYRWGSENGDEVSHWTYFEGPTE